MEKQSIRERIKEESIIAGRNAVSELMRSGREIDSIYIQKGSREGSIVALIAKARQRSIPIKEVDPRKLESLSGVSSHQGIVAVVAAWEYATLEQLYERGGDNPFFVVCDHIEDPHNLGAILRTAEAAGAHGVIIPKRGGVGLTPTVAKSSAGAVAHIPVARVANIASTVTELKQRGIWTYCAHMDGKPWCQTDYSGGVALVVGSEGDGVSRIVQKTCDQSVSLPMIGKVGSLNASVAAGIVLYEIARQRTGVSALVPKPPKGL